MPVESNSSLLLVASEASSCLYANKLIEKFRSELPNVQFFGIGDQAMEKKGMNRIGRSEDLAIMGLFEVLKHWRPIKRVFYDIIDEAKRIRPKAAILLDYPGFNLRLAERLKAMNIPVYYYISPQIWAWKKNRIHKIKKLVDEMFVVLPFEVEFYKKNGMDVNYVGHPLVEVMEPFLKSHKDQESSYSLGLMPGSRINEIQRNLPIQLKAAEKLFEKHKNFSVAVLKAESIDIQWLTDLIKGLSSLNVSVLEDDPTKMILQNRALLVASGTATLQVALCGKPQIAMYRMNSATAWFAKRWVNQVKYFCLVNLIADQKLVPEYFQEEATPEILARDLEKCLFDSNFSQNMLKGFDRVHHLLGDRKATNNVYNILVNQLGLDQ